MINKPELEEKANAFPCSYYPRCEHATCQVAHLCNLVTQKDQEISILKAEVTAYRDGVVESLGRDIAQLLQTIMALKETAQKVNEILPEAKGFSDAVISICEEAIEAFPAPNLKRKDS